MEEPMSKTIKARFQAGKLEPIEPLELEEGKEVVITVTEPATPGGPVDPIAATSGAWKDLLDCEQFEKDVYESRLVQTRPEVRW
jgi:predicted DNA-binding antitoxin AbrB/MazE fold protein